MCRFASFKMARFYTLLLKSERDLTPTYKHKLPLTPKEYKNPPLLRLTIFHSIGV
jgi:hypothetical protein